MSDVRISDTRVYRVVKDKPVTLTVVVGDKQVGGTALALNGVRIPFDNAAGSAQIGSDGTNLVNSILQVLTTVKDQATEHNRTSVTLRLSGGIEPCDYPYAVDVKQDKGLARYSITFLFTE